MVYLECKLQEDTDGSSIHKLKSWKTVERTYLETRKQQPWYRRCFSVLKCLRKANDSIFALCQQTSNKQQRRYRLTK